MSVALTMENESLRCPLCGQSRTMKSIELWDRSYVSRNKISPQEADLICEDGVFEVQVCIHCGFKYMKNPGKAAASQLYGALMNYFITKIHTADPEDMDALEAEFYTVSGKKYVSSADLPAMKLRLIKNVNDYFRDCPIDDLVEAYNSLAVSQIEEAHGSIIKDEEIAIKKPLKTMEVLGDD